jgi:Uma2 family endonuclease
MSVVITPRPMTVEEFSDWVERPENADRWFELVRGEVTELPPPTRALGVVCMSVGRLLWNFAFQQGKGYVAANDSGVILERHPDTVRGPDVAFYDDARTFSELHPKYGETPPRLAVEVLSPNDKARQVTRKITDYLRNGVPLVWLIDPESRTVTVYCTDKGPILVEGDQYLEGGEVLPGFRCRAAELFALPGEPIPPRVEAPPP